MRARGPKEGLARHGIHVVRRVEEPIFDVDAPLRREALPPDRQRDGLALRARSVDRGVIPVVREEDRGLAPVFGYRRRDIDAVRVRFRADLRAEVVEFPEGFEGVIGFQRLLRIGVEEAVPLDAVARVVVHEVIERRALRREDRGGGVGRTLEPDDGVVRGQKIRPRPALHVVPFVQDQLGVGVAVPVCQGARGFRVPGEIVGFAAVVVEGEEVERRGIGGIAGEIAEESVEEPVTADR